MPDVAKSLERIFISYRHEDGGGYAGRLFDHLAAHFGNERVFMDVDAIRPGEDFVQRIESSIAESDAVIVLIGRQWLSAADVHGNRRLDDPRDFVRIEIAAALKHGKRVIPALVEDTQMPRKEDLPHPIAALAYREAVELSSSKFQRDVDDLIRSLDPDASPNTLGTSVTFQQFRSTPFLSKVGQLVLPAFLLAVALLAYGGWPGSFSRYSTKRYKQDLAPLAVSTFTFPDDGEPDKNGHLGPFCCGGRTATIRRTDGSIAGYVYFFRGSGQPKSTGYPAIDILVSAGNEQGTIQFVAPGAQPGVTQSARVEHLKFSARLLDVLVHRDENPQLIDSKGLRIRVTVSDVAR